MIWDNEVYKNALHDKYLYCSVHGETVISYHRYVHLFQLLWMLGVRPKKKEGKVYEQM